MIINLRVLLALACLCVFCHCKKVPLYGTASIVVTSEGPEPDIYIGLFQGWVNPQPEDLLENKRGYYLMGVKNASSDSQELAVGSYTVMVVDKNNMVFSYKKFVINDGDNVELNTQLPEGNHYSFMATNWGE